MFTFKCDLLQKDYCLMFEQKKTHCEQIDEEEKKKME